ncbi:glutathione s-transferase [Stylonychia lemnae]|uniref:Glutathione s-transferase n=1 Tax=Stylonychia lemnae TaxID=5949 RepID=A0A078A9D7_STYLE|nr:glutathione s-transferase [Stylonychia lemnae]|eukprot:CDW78212.1 glutathione s-transferase [Stylonychia lemnae]
MALKLYYFDYSGRAESMRMLLNHAKVEFEDIRIKKDDWPAFQLNDNPSLEFKQIPVLQIDNGKVLSQSKAILRYLGNEYGYYPKDPYEAYLVDSFIDGLSDMIQGMVASKFEPNQEKSKAMVLDWLKNDYPRFLSIYEKRFESQGDSKYAVGNTLTIADFSFCALIFSTILNEQSSVSAFLRGPFEQNPRLNAYAAEMREFFKEYLELKPKESI